MVFSTSISATFLRVLVVSVFILTFVFVSTASLEAASPVTVGVVRSQLSHAYGNRTPPHSFHGGVDVAGREDAMIRQAREAGFNVTILSDTDLENRTMLDSLDVVILPYTAAMTLEASVTLRDWVQDGGGLIPILASPRAFLTPENTWQLWVLEIGSESWEWGPLSQAYQMMFVNDPNVPQWEAHLNTNHVVTENTLKTLNVGEAFFERPSPGSGAEFSYAYNGNVVSLADFSGITGEFEKYNSMSAIQATTYGSGKIVYVTFPLMDFLPYYNYNLSILPAGVNISQGELADVFLTEAVSWAGVPSSKEATPVPLGVTFGNVAVYGDAVYVQQFIRPDTPWPVTGTAYARLFRPNGSLFGTHVVENVGVEPGAQRMYSIGFRNNAPLQDGLWRVELEYVFSNPDYDQSSLAQVYVYRSQGKNIPTEPVTVFETDFSHLTQIGLNEPASFSVSAPQDSHWVATVNRHRSFETFSFQGSGSQVVNFVAPDQPGPYTVTVVDSQGGSLSHLFQVGSHVWPFVDDDFSYASDEIAAMFDNEITFGCDWNKFCPTAVLTRAELMTFIARAHGDVYQYPLYKGYYGDVDAGQWFTRPVEFLVSNGVLPGGETLGVSQPATRALAVDVIMNVLVGSTGYGEHKGYFSDVGPNDWFYPKIERAYEMGIAKGYPDGTFRPYGLLNRQDAAAFIMRAL